MKTNSLQELYVEQLRDLYDAENQIIKALPKMIEAAQSEELHDALNEHLEVTKQQASRLETIFEKLGESEKGEKCKGMEGVLKEGSELLKNVGAESVKDAAIIAGAQRVEHYEMAGYGTARNYASLLGDEEAAELLQKTLDEEKEADEKLTQLSEQINVDANDTQRQDSQAERAKTTAAKRRRVA
jgi:ferritin-like metal-binding protein YciE